MKFQSIHYICITAIKIDSMKIDEKNFPPVWWKSNKCKYKIKKKKMENVIDADLDLDSDDSDDFNSG